MTTNTATRPTILVVDDEVSIRQVARRILEGAGYDVREAADGQAAIDLLADGAPLDLLMADLDMPGLGGDDMAQQIRTTRPAQRVLYVTGHIDRLMDARLLLGDGEAFLEKPFTGPGLLEAVALILYGTLSKPS
ncbi:MAG: response regulator [Acidobacteriota bacterium]|nr:response regulator [Acidobacteriota bacterium]